MEKSDLASFVGVGPSLRLPSFFTDSFSEVLSARGITYEHSGSVLALGSEAARLAIYAEGIRKSTGPVLVFDPTGDIYRETAAERVARFGSDSVRVLDLLSEKPTFRLNALDDIRVGTVDEVEDAQQLAWILCDPCGSEFESWSSSEFWKAPAYQCVAALLLHFVYLDAAVIPTKNLGTFVEYLEALDAADDGYASVFCEMRNYPHDPAMIRGWTIAGGGPFATCPFIATVASEMLLRPEADRLSMLYRIKSWLTAFGNPLIVENTSVSDVPIDFLGGSVPYTVYILQSSDLEDVTTAAIRVLVQTIVGRGMERSERQEGDPGFTSPALAVLDEFPDLLGMEIFGASLPWATQRGLSYIFGIESVSRFEPSYLHEQAALFYRYCTIFASGVKGRETADLLAQMAGSRMVPTPFFGTQLPFQRRVFLTAKDILLVEFPRFLVVDVDVSVMVLEVPSVDDVQKFDPADAADETGPMYRLPAYFSGTFDQMFVDRRVVYDRTGSVLALGSQRSRALVYQAAILNSSGPVLVYDPTGEIYRSTAVERATRFGKQSVGLFDPLSVDRLRLNVFDVVRLGTPHEVSDVQSIARMLVDPQGGATDTASWDHWKKTAYAFFYGVILHFLYLHRSAVPRKNLADFAWYIEMLDHSNGVAGLREAFHEMAEYPHDSEGARGWKGYDGSPSLTCPTVYMVAADAWRRHDGESGAIYSSVKAYLGPYREWEITNNIKDSDIPIEFLSRAFPYTVYLTRDWKTEQATTPILRLLLNTMISCGFDRRTIGAGGTGLAEDSPLVVLDDFTSLRQLDILEKTLPLAASQGVSYVFGTDSIPMIEGLYTRKQTSLFYQNCTVLASGVKDTKTAEVLSQMIASARPTVRPGTHDGYMVKARAFLTASEILALNSWLILCVDRDATGVVLEFAQLQPKKRVSTVFSVQVLSDDAVLVRDQHGKVTETIVGAQGRSLHRAISKLISDDSVA